MPALPPVPNVIKTVVRQVIGDFIGENILHFPYTGSAPTDATIGTIAQGIFGAWVDHLLPAQNSGLALETVECTDLTSDTGAQGSYTGDGPTGGDGSTALPANCALVVSNEISRRYRGGHPRTYIMGVSDSGLDTVQFFSSAYANGMTSDFEAMLTAVAALSVSGTDMGTQVSVSYRSGNAPRVTPVVDPVIAHVGKIRVCSQRRRLGKVNG
jgi:hypothetical protein